MASTSDSLTGTGGGSLLLLRHGEQYTYAITGTFVGTVRIERTQDGGGSYTVVSDNFTTTGSGTLTAETPDAGHASYRFNCTAYTSGTIVVALADVNDVTHEFKNKSNVTYLKLREGVGVESSLQHLGLNSGATATDIAGYTVRLNHVTNTGTANDLIGFQCKPAQGVATAKNVIGAEISPRVADTFALTGSGTLIGLHVDATLQGTTGNIAGDVRGIQIELISASGSSRTVAGNVSGLRIRSNFISGNITGLKEAIRIEIPETPGTGYDSVLTLTGAHPGIWNSAPSGEPSTADGYIKVNVNGAVRYIQLYSGAPTD